MARPALAAAPRASANDALPARLAAFDWQRIGADLDACGYARLPGLLPPSACVRLAALYDDPARFRARVTMARHGFGRGEYQYFAAPLPAAIAGLRTGLYAHLAPIANRWRAALGAPTPYPPDLDAFLARCHAAGQTRPTPLLLRYRAGDHNCLHQDVYGAVAFPLQVACLLSRPGADFDGGEFVLVEQRPRRQSRATVVALAQGDAVVFAVRERPVAGARGIYRAQLRHGVSDVRRGRRETLGMIFHDAA